ncbi:MAG: hypothetical protein ACYCTF_05810 [Acidiferrobacter sp.]
MGTQKMSRLRARVAPYKEAIAKARAAGATWGDIGRLIGAGDRQVRLAVKHCRYEAEQIDLPEPETKTTKEVQPTQTQKPARTASGREFFNSIPKI